MTTLAMPSSAQVARFAQPTVRDVHPIDPVLTNLSIGGKHDKFLWDQIAPVSAQPQKSGTYPLYTRDFWFKRQAGAIRTAGGPYLRVGYGVTTDTFNCLERGFEKQVEDVVVAANLFGDDPSKLATAFVTNLIQLELEKDAAAAYFVTGVWGTSNTLAGANQWSDYDGSDPIANADTAIRTIKRNTGARPTTMFVGLLAWERLKEHPLITDKFKYTQKGIMTPDLVAATLGVDELIVGDTVENTAAEGATFVGADIWADNALFVVRNNPALLVSNGGYTFMWNEKGNIPWGVESYRDEPVRSDIVRAFTHYDMQIVSAQHGYIFLDCVA